MIDHLMLGPSTHGVTRHGAALAGASRTVLPDVGPDGTALRQYLGAATTPVHVHLTDHLLGDTPEDIERSLDVLASARRPIHVTLHDIPQPAEGEARFARRSGVYARLARTAASVQVCSRSELAMLSGLLDDPEIVARIGVVPLPIDIDPARIERVRRGWARADADGPVGVLGFVHPGKDPHLALDLAARAGRDVVLLGAVVAGHEDFYEELRDAAREQGVSVEATGFLDEDALDEAIGGVAVPLAPYRHVSASGSIGRWIAAGRRPIVLSTPWADELAEAAPWAVHVVTADELPAAVARALRDPDLTWTPPRHDGLLSTSQAAAAQAAFLAEVTRG